MSVLVRLTVVLALLIVYILLYAPLVMIHSKYVKSYEANWLLYRPVDVLFDRSEYFQISYLKWARIWGVEQKFIVSAYARDYDRLHNGK